MYEYIVKPTDVKKQPYADFIVIMHPSDMEKPNIKTNDYVKLTRTVSNGNKKLDLEILAHTISSEHKLSRMTSNSSASLKLGEVGVDQTCREALGLIVGKTVIISKTGKKYGFMGRLFTLLDFQKAIVRVQANATYMEHKTPIVCLCEEMLDSIGATYGDRIVVESNHSKIIVKCAKLTPCMQEFHDFVLDPSKENKEKVELELTSRDSTDPSSSKGYFIDPSDWDIKSERVRKGDMTHPIFMDKISMDLLNVKRLHPVKIRRSLWWEIQKKLNSFGNVSLLAFSVMLAFLVEDPSSIILWIWIITLGIWGSWSILTASNYKTST